MPSPGARAEVVPRRASKVILVQTGRSSSASIRQRAVVEGRVGQHVDDGRPGRQHPVLDPQVRACRRRCRRSAGSSGRRCRCAAAAPAAAGASPGLEHRHRVLVGGLRQQRREVADVLLEQVEDRGDPALAEEHPRPHALVLQLDRAGVGGLQEQLDPGLGPQPLAEEERRVRAERQLRRRPAPARRSSARRSRAGATCRCSCTEVQADSGAMESAYVGEPLARSGPRCRGRCPRRGRRRSASFRAG